MKNKWNKLMKFLLNPGYRFLILADRGFYNHVDDIAFLEKMFSVKMGYNLDIDNPKTYNEKLQWLKVYDKNPEYTKLVDKYEVRKYVEKKIGEEYLIPLLGIWDTAEEINFSELPQFYVLKCTHNSGLGMVICNKKSQPSRNEVVKKLRRGLKEEYYYKGREWPYKNVKPRIIGEQLLGDGVHAPDDYKFYVFDGVIDSVMVCKGREKGYPTFYFYDSKWQRKYYQNVEDLEGEELPKPENFEKMLELVTILSQGFKQIRVDLYNIGGKIYFGELTFFNQSGFDVDITKETDRAWGEKLVLQSK